MRPARASSTDDRGNDASSSPARTEAVSVAAVKFSLSRVFAAMLMAASVVACGGSAPATARPTFRGAAGVDQCALVSDQEVATALGRTDLTKQVASTFCNWTGSPQQGET